MQIRTSPLRKRKRPDHVIRRPISVSTLPATVLTYPAAQSGKEGVDLATTAACW